MLELVQERPDDWWEVETLYDTCFAPGRELLSSYRLRRGVPAIPDLCLTIRDTEGDILAAAIRYWPVRVGAGGAPALILGPVAVHPTRQGEGLGGWLVRDSLKIARRLGWQRVLLVGDLPYYGRFGFAKLVSVRMPPPTNPERVLGLELVPGAWAGITGRVRKWS